MNNPYIIVLITVTFQILMILCVVYVADTFFGTYPKREWITFFGVLGTAAFGFWFMTKLMEER